VAAAAIAAAAGGITAIVTVVAAPRSAATLAAAIQAAATGVAVTPGVAATAKAARFQHLQAVKCAQRHYLLQRQFSLPPGKVRLFFPTRPGHVPGRVGI
jgi:hypothetical protein